MVKKNSFLFLSFLLLVVLKISAQNEVIVKSNTESIDLFQSALIIEDAESKLSIKEILSGELTDKFKPAKGFIKLPAANKGYWLKVTVSSQIDDFIYTYQNYVGTVEAVLYEANGQEVVHQQTISHLGTDKPMEEFRQSVLYTNLKLQKGETHTLILFVRGAKMIYLPWFVASEQAFVRKTHRNDLFYGFVYGLFVIIIVYNFMLYFRLGENDYLFYALSMFFLALLLFNYHGHPYEFFLNGKQHIKNHVEIYAGLAGVFHLLFAKVFLRFKQYGKWINGLFNVLVILYVLDIIVNILGFSDALFPWFSAGTTSLIADLYIISVAVYIAFKGFTPAILFLISRIFLIISVFITAFYSLGQLEHSEFAYNALHIGASLEMIFFSFAISYKIRLLKTEKDKAKKEKEDYIKSQNILLEEKVISRTRELVQEQEKSELLLLNILPKTIAEEIKEKGKIEAQVYKNVTILFTDFEGFTNNSQKISAENLIAELNYYFKKFDEITTRYNIEKIKTIGDAYMAAGGLPIVGDKKTIALNCVKAALEMQQFVTESAKKAEHRVLSRMRVGVHTGDVIAGIVGDKKYQYDIWGEAVNLASRIENAGEVGKVNISEATHALVKDAFKCTHRGQIHAKNIGEIDMYFVE